MDIRSACVVLAGWLAVCLAGWLAGRRVGAWGCLGGSFLKFIEQLTDCRVCQQDHVRHSCFDLAYVFDSLRVALRSATYLHEY